jgi:hypothetical protein
METVADAHIFGHHLGVAVTCKVRHRFEINPAGRSKSVGTWEIFDVSHALPDGTYTIDAGGHGGWLANYNSGKWTQVRR